MFHAANPEDKHVLVEMALQCVADSKRWFPNVTDSIPHHTLAMAGEVGEFANIVKKIERGDLDIHDAATRNKLAMELTDVMVYLLNIAGLLRINLAVTYDVVRKHNEKRFYTDKQVNNHG